MKGASRSKRLLGTFNLNGGNMSTTVLDALRNAVVEAAKVWLVTYEEEVRNLDEEAPCKNLVQAVDELNAFLKKRRARGVFPAGIREGRV